jgi:hypothetical protein
MGNQVIHLIVGEITLFLSCINEFRDVVKSQAESISAPSWIGFPYAFCGAILCDVDASTSSIIVPVDGPRFEYPARFRANEMRRNCVPLSGDYVTRELFGGNTRYEERIA